MISLQLIKRAPRVRPYIPLAAAIGVLAIGYLWFLRPIQQTVYAGSRTEYVETLYQERLGRLQNIVNRQKEQLDQLVSWKREHDSLFFSSDQLGLFFSNLDQHAVSFGCQVVSADYEILNIPGQNPQGSTNGIYLQGAEIRLAGRYDRWIGLLEWIESLPQSVLIDSVELESNKDRPGILNGRIELAIPVRKKSEDSEKTFLLSDKEN